MRDRWQRILTDVSTGISIKEAVRREGVTLAAYSRWRVEYPGFNEMMDTAKVQGRLNKHGPRKEGFTCPDFRIAVFGRNTEPHQYEWDQWFDSDEDHVLILAAPESGKSTYLVDRVCYEVYRNPDIRIGYVSRSQPHSRKMIGRIKGVITQNRQFKNLCGDLKPGAGDKHPWREDYFMVRTRSFEAGEDEADYTVAAFGAGTQITGSRIDLLIVDDPDDVGVDQATRQKILDVILQAVETRLGTVGRLVIIGNRQNPDDVYGMIIQQEQEDPGLWKIFSRPAIAVKGTTNAYPFEPGMDYGDHADKVDIIWPEKYGSQKYKGRCRYEECKHRDRGKGPNFEKKTWAVECAWTFFMRKKRRLRHRFDMIYQMVAEGHGIRDFDEALVEPCLNREISFGEVPPGAVKIATLDPASTGGSGVMVLALYRSGDGNVKMRVVDLDWGVNKRTPGLLEWIDLFGARYRPRWWGIDKQGPNRLFVESPETERHARAWRGTVIPMSTPAGTHKDPSADIESKGSDVAVSNLVTRFVDDVIEIPYRTDEDKAKAQLLLEQLYWYSPTVTRPIDLVMCLSYADRMVQNLGLERRLGLQADRVEYLQGPYQQQWGAGAGWSGSGAGGWSLTPEGGKISSQEVIAGDKPLADPWQYPKQA